MIIVPVNPNVIEIRRIQTGCLKSEFDSTYPVQLNGIIRPDEFLESMENINRESAKIAPVVILSTIGGLCLISGIALFIAGGLTASHLKTNGFPILVGVGIGLFFLGLLIFLFGCCFIRTQLATRMRTAIANESMKYSTRSPTPCSWRLHTSTFVTGGPRNRRTVYVYHLIIEIGRYGTPGSGYVPQQFNQGYTQPTSFFLQVNATAPPPPYNDFSAGGFCSQCGMPRQNSAARFCPSCGQPFR